MSGWATFPARVRVFRSGGRGRRPAQPSRPGPGLRRPCASPASRARPPRTRLFSPWAASRATQWESRWVSSPPVSEIADW